jgi:hypothetical protein
MSNPLYSIEEVLGQLDSCAKSFTFPMLDNSYVYPADVRLTAYRDDARWALVIEVLGAQYRVGGHGSICDCLHCFGNCLNGPPGTANEDFLNPTADGDDSPTFDDEYDWYVNEEAHTIRIRDTIVPIRFRDDALEAKGIRLEEPPRVNGAELLRALLPEYRELLLGTEEELRQRVPTDLPMILRLDEWHHPDLAEGELPSRSRTFQMIAEVLATGDPTRYQPTQEPNTHWSNWADGGTL